MGFYCKDKSLNRLSHMISVEVLSHKLVLKLHTLLWSAYTPNFALLVSCSGLLFCSLAPPPCCCNGAARPIKQTLSAPPPPPHPTTNPGTWSSLLVLKLWCNNYVSIFEICNLPPSAASLLHDVSFKSCTILLYDMSTHSPSLTRALTAA